MLQLGKGKYSSWKKEKFPLEKEKKIEKKILKYFNQRKVNISITKSLVFQLEKEKYYNQKKENIYIPIRLRKIFQLGNEK